MSKKLRDAGFAEEELNDVLQKIKLSSQAKLFEKLQKVLNETKSEITPSQSKQG
jgi:ferritin-like metal-binding protein YciE